MDDRATDKGEENAAEEVSSTVHMSDEQKRQFLRDEYLFLQQTYEDFDKRALSIKSWAVTICFVGIGLGFQHKTAAFWLISASGALLFWLVEARWKTAQYSHALRIRRIEGHLRGDWDKQGLVPFQIYHSWYRAYAFDDSPHRSDSRKRRTLWQRTIANAWIPFVRTPYMHICVISVALLMAHGAIKSGVLSQTATTWLKRLLAW